MADSKHPDEAMVEHPAAYLKFWFDADGRPSCRVDMTDICEPWLDKLKPTITPLYPRPAVSSLGDDERAERKMSQRLRDYRAWKAQPREINPEDAGREIEFAWGDAWLLGYDAVIAAIDDGA
jgi:hypothetical protein